MHLFPLILKKIKASHAKVKTVSAHLWNPAKTKITNSEDEGDAL
jgi:hypothetical protein